MNKRIRIYLLILIISLITLMIKEVDIEVYAKGEKKNYRSDVIVVGYKDNITASKKRMISNLIQTEEETDIPQINVKSLKIPKNKTVEEMISVLEGNPNIEYVEPDYYAHFNAVTLNDTLFSSQNAALNMIRMRDAWEYTGGSFDIIIGLVDTGVNVATLPDLAGRVLPGSSCAACGDSWDDVALGGMGRGLPQ